MSSYPGVLVKAPRHPRAVERARLATWPADRAGVVLVGPAGSGKTVAALHLARAAGARLAWCRLAPGYAGATDLVGMAAASCGAEAPDAGDPVALADALLAVLEAEPTVLVVDDYHHADASACDPMLAEVLGLVPTASHVVVTTQVRPAGVLGRLPAGLVHVVDADALAFTEDEAAALFRASGNSPDAAAAWRDRTGGWAAALALAAEAETSGPVTPNVDVIVEELLLARLPEAERAVLEAMAALPYVDAVLLDALGLGDGDALATLGRSTTLVVEATGMWRLHDIARDAIVRRLAPEQASSMRRRAAEVLASADPVTAVELLLDAGDPEAATKVLGASVSAIGPARATLLAYRLPAALRHRLPPVLTGGRATVDLDLATASALERVERATSDDERAEALLALGSARAGAGDLGGALEAFEPVAARGGDPRQQLAQTWVGIVRWWAGDLDGARSALAPLPDTVWACWARGHVALADGLRTEAVRWATRAVEVAEGSADVGTTVAPGESLLTAAALLDGDVGAAEAHALRADAAGEAAGGFDQACGATAIAWVRARQGRAADAEAACGRVERKVGRHDRHARLGAALVRLAVAEGTEDRERAARRVRDLRRLGFGPVEALARSLLPRLAAPSGDGLRVDLLEPGQVHVDGDDRTGGWRSRKALEVLRLLAVTGPSGATRERVIEAVWPGREADKGRTLLRTALSEIRRVLEPDRQPGEASRFVRTDGERIAVVASCDLVEARAAAAAGDWRRSFELVDRPTADLDAAGEWAEELRREVDRLRVDAAEHVAAADPADARALAVLIEAEPWRRELYDALAAVHRAAGDEAAARAVERRWFESDD